MVTVRGWWIAMSALSGVNLAAWAVVAARAFRKPPADPGEHAARRRLLALATVFMLVCAFRSVVPRADVQRIVLVDSWLSSVMVGRAVATVAELCLAAQWALLLGALARGAGVAAAAAIARAILPVIAVAECFSWFATVTTNFLGNTLEQSTWMLTGALIAVGMALAWRRLRGGARALAAAAVVLNLCYVTFMCTVDIPMYFTRWRADEHAGRRYLGLVDGIRDTAGRWIVTFRWEDWHREMPWMTFYFTLGVWVSLALVHAPLGERARAERATA